MCGYPDGVGQGEQLIEGAGGLDHTAVAKGHSGAELGRIAQRITGQNDSLALSRLCAKRGFQFEASGWVETGEWLVEEEKVVIPEEQLSETEGRVRTAECGARNWGNVGVTVSRPLCWPYSAAGGRGDGGHSEEVLEEAGEFQPETRSAWCGDAGEIAGTGADGAAAGGTAEQFNFALRRTQATGEDFEEGGFAATSRPEKTKEIAPIHLEVQIIQGVHESAAFEKPAHIIQRDYDLAPDRG